MKAKKLFLPCEQPGCKNGKLSYVRTVNGIDVYICDKCHQNTTSESDPCPDDNNQFMMSL